MPAILAWLGRIAEILASVLGIVQILHEDTSHSAQEYQPYEMLKNLQLTEATVGAMAPYVSTIDANTAGLAALIATARSDILAAIAGITFPPTPPTGWVTGVATGVWDYQDPYGNGQDQGHLLVRAGNLPQQLLYTVGLPMAGAPEFVKFGPWGESDSNSPYNPPVPDWADIRPDDTRLSWLQRTDTAHLWQARYLSLDPYYILDPSPLGAYWSGEPAFTEADFEAWKAASRRNRAPVWPGEDNVTLGTPVALSANLTVDGPLDGVLVNVTTPPSGLGKFAIGDLTAYYRIGQIAFITDHGEAEPWQYLSWDQGVYCPKAQARAASAILSVLAGAGGTATPWLAT